MLIATKVGLEWKDGQPFRKAAARIVKEVEIAAAAQDRRDRPLSGALARSEVPIEETADAMAKLYQSGKIRAIGVNNFRPPRWIIPAISAAAPGGRRTICSSATLSVTSCPIVPTKYRHVGLRLALPRPTDRADDGCNAIRLG